MKTVHLWVALGTVALGSAAGFATVAAVDSVRRSQGRIEASQGPTRITAVESSVVDYSRVIVFRDSATGAEYLAYKGGIVKLEKTK